MLDYNYMEENMRVTNLNVVKEVLKYLKALAKHYNLPYKEFSNVPDTFLYNYVELSKYQKEDIALLLKQKHCNYQALLNECIYDFLSREPLVDMKEVPFVENIDIKDRMILDTTIGNVKLLKASDYFKNSKSSYIFNKKLTGECFDKTLEFVRENEEYEAIVSYVPNVFVGGHFHAYAKNSDTIVDIASNAIYFDKTGELIEKGEVLFSSKYENISGSIGEEPPYLLKRALK